MHIEQTLSTTQLAAAFHVQPRTIFQNLSTKGHFLGLKPTKLPNSRLIWSAEDAAKLLRGESLAAPQKTAA